MYKKFVYPEECFEKLSVIFLFVYVLNRIFNVNLYDILKSLSYGYNNIEVQCS